MVAEAWFDRVAGWPVARLATVRRSGQPRVVPCCFALDGELLYSAVDEKPKTTHQLGRLDDIAANPAVSLVVDHYADDWSELWWARLDGQARVVEDGPERDHALDCLAAKYIQYRQTRPTGAVIAVRVERWQTWAFGPP